jgi:4-carboxymuconolactone decarboxylase
MAEPQQDSEEDRTMEKKLPSAYRRFMTEHPRVGEAYERLSEAALTEGPLSRKQAELVKVGIALGARLESAVHSHVRRALEAGATADEIRHAIRLSLTTTGFPAMMAGLAWARDVLDGERSER